MKRTLTSALFLLLFSATLAQADSGISAPAFTTGPDDERIHITPALQLSINTSQPFICTVKTRGAIALDSRVHLCACDGEAWKILNTDEVCAWTPAGR